MFVESKEFYYQKNEIELEEDRFFGIWDDPLEYDYLSYKYGYSYTKKQTFASGQKDWWGHTGVMKKYNFLLFP